MPDKKKDRELTDKEMQKVSGGKAATNKPGRTAPYGSGGPVPGPVIPEPKRKPGGDPFGTDERTKKK